MTPLRKPPTRPAVAPSREFDTRPASQVAPLVHHDGVVRAAVWLGVVVPFLTALTACGAARLTPVGDVPNAGLPARTVGSVSIGSFASAQIAAYCAYAVRCQIAGTQTGCQLATQLGLSPDLLAAVDAGTVTFDPQQAYRCVQLIEDAPCNLGRDVIRHPTLLAACDLAFSPTLSTGAACTLGAACVSGTCDVASASGCSGTCAPNIELRSVALGDLCGSDRECVEGAACSRASETCQPMAVEGQSCADVLCQLDLNCVATASAGNICLRPVGVGDSCAVAPCGADTAAVSCDLARSICTAYLQPGDSCTGTAVPCPVFAPCNGSVCLMSAPLGAACVGTGTTPCEQGIEADTSVECTNGVCTQAPPPAVATSCGSA